MSAQLCPHNAYFVIPVIMMGRRERMAKLLVFLAINAALGALAFRLSKSSTLYGYLECTVGCHLLLHDLRPNIGLWWYVFIEMFEHFRNFFLATFQLLPLAFVVPGAVRLRDDPLFYCWFVSSVLAILKPYPTVVDVALSMQLLFLRPAVLERCGMTLLVAMAAGLFVGYLMPIVWYYWMVQGSGNSNFYYAATLAANAVQMVVAVTVTGEYLKWKVEQENPELLKEKPDEKSSERLFQQ